MSKTYDFDVTRAVGILNTAMRANMFAQGGIPESDADKIIAAEKVVASAEQAKDLADAIGKERVPLYDSILAVLFEAQVLVGTDRPQATNGSTAVEEPDSTDAVIAHVDAELARPQPDARQLELEAEAAPMEKQSTWADPAGGLWTVVRDLGPQVEVLSAAGEPTVVPRGFLKVMKTSGHLDLVVVPKDNAVFVHHHGCMRWVYPLDDTILPKVGDTKECDNCASILPIGSIDDGGYVPPTHESSPLATTATTTPVETIINVVPKPVPEEDPSTPSLSSPAPSSSESAQEVDDTEGDQAYAEIVERVERDWSPPGMPVPRDMEDEPLPMVADLTADESMNRRLHSQFNALAARARYLGGLERAKAREIARARKLRMRPAMREARKLLGANATVTEVKEEAEQDEVVASWIVREARHADKAAAYQTFFEIYTDNVSVLSRDLTWAGTEERGS